LTVTAASTLSPDSAIDRIFGVVLQPSTYRNLLYLAISMPLGIMYFVSMITGLSIAVGTAIILVGFLVLAITLMLARLFGRLEREMVRSLLGATFETRPPRSTEWRAQLTDRYNWTTILYLFLRFPIGIAGFVTSVLFAVSIAVMAAPMLYTLFPFTVGTHVIDNSQEALLVSLFGCVLFLVCAHAVNGLAAVSRRLALMLL
jgi:hypothetical protein